MRRRRGWGWGTGGRWRGDDWCERGVSEVYGRGITLLPAAYHGVFYCYIGMA